MKARVPCKSRKIQEMSFFLQLFISETLELGTLVYSQCLVKVPGMNEWLLPAVSICSKYEHIRQQVLPTDVSLGAFFSQP